MSPTRVNALGLASLTAAIVLALFVALDLAGTIRVELPFVIVLTGFGSTCGFGYIAGRLSENIISRVLGRLDLIEARQAEIRTSLAAIPDVVEEQVDARVVAERLAEFRSLAPKVNGHEVTRLRTAGE